MKTALLFVFLTAVGTTPSLADDSIQQRIVNFPVVVSLVKSTETAYDVKCGEVQVLSLGTENQIQTGNSFLARFSCMNSGDDYRTDVTIEGFTGGMQPFQVTRITSLTAG